MKRDHCCCNTLFVLRRNGGTCAVSVPRPSRSKVNGWLANLNCSLYLIIPLSVNLLVCYTVDRHTQRENVRVSGSTYCTAENTISANGMYLGGLQHGDSPNKDISSFTRHLYPKRLTWGGLCIWFHWALNSGLHACKAGVITAGAVYSWPADRHHCQMDCGGLSAD